MNPSPSGNNSPFPASATIYLIRHAEKPASGSGLSPEGQARAQAYVKYFQNLQNPSGQAITWDNLFASTDSDNSDRPVLTITPLANQLKLTINSNFADKHYKKLVDELKDPAQGSYAGKNILICWHHGEILDLATKLGASPSSLPSSSNWPAKWNPAVFGWLLQIYYDANGAIITTSSRTINEHLMSDDTIDPVYDK
jgi:hypothetical protein